MPVYATAIRPICHIEIPPTDYFERRPQNATLALDDNVAVSASSGILQSSQQCFASTSTGVKAFGH